MLVSQVLLACLLALFKLASASDPTCGKGLLSRDGAACCAHSCGRCGGTSCQNLPGGASKCCSSRIEGAGQSCKTHDPPCVMPAGPPPPPATKVNPKRGFVADGAQSCDTPLLLNVSGWYYGYNVNNPYRSSTLKGDCARANATDKKRFVPMNWCLSSMHKAVPADVDDSIFMGFNEPNNLHNCNTDAETVAKAWATVMQLHPNSELVSPATSGNGIKWYDEFFSNCTHLYGPKGCNVSYLATHDYSCTPSSTLAYLKQLHERYGKKVWLTEFSCGDHAQGRPMAEHVEFMKAVLPLLDGADYVARYSWMSARDASDRRGLVETDAQGTVKLTELGQIWNS